MISAVKTLLIVLFALSTSLFGAAQQKFSSFAGEYECLLFDGDYSDSLLVPGALRDISKCPDGMIVRGKLSVSIMASGAFTAKADYIESKPAGVLKNSALTESGTLRIPESQYCTEGIKILRDVSRRQVSFKGVLTSQTADSAQVDWSKKVTVSGGDYNLDFKVTLEDLQTLYEPSLSTQPKISASFTDRSCLKDLNRPSYISKGSGFVAVSKFPTQSNPSGRYIHASPAVDDPDFSGDLSTGLTLLAKINLSASGLTSFSIQLEPPFPKLFLFSGRLLADGTVVFYGFLSIDAPGNTYLLNPLKGAKCSVAWAFAGMAKLVRHPLREFELLIGPESYTESSCLLKSGNKNVMSNSTNFQWRADNGVWFNEISGVNSSDDPTERGEGSNEYEFNAETKSILSKNHRLSKSAGQYSLIVGDPQAPLVKYGVSLSAKGALTNAVLLSQGSWSVSGAKGKALKMSFNATEGQITGTLQVLGEFYKNGAEADDNSKTPKKVSRTISLFGGVYDEPAAAFNGALKGRVIAIGNANPYTPTYSDLGPAWILVDETQ